MAYYVMSAGNNIRTGHSGIDIFDGYGGDDGRGATGGTDTLNGMGGNDVFLIDRQLRAAGGTIDGGADTDTVHAYGFDLGTYTFLNVEILSIDAFEFSARIDQLNAFSTITSAIPEMGRIKFYLQGAGGTIDLSTRMAAGRSVELNALNLTSGYNVTGSSLDDVFTNSSHDDIVRGGNGNDTFWALNTPGNGGFDRLYGGSGDDAFHLSGQSGTIDGGSGTDTVYSSNLSDATFVNVEVLNTGGQILTASLSQLKSFARITGSSSVSLNLGTNTGGTIDFTTKITGSGSSVIFNAADASSAVDVTGTMGNDVLYGSDFNDTLRGGAGNDVLRGVETLSNSTIAAQGQDTLYGGAGNDRYLVDPTDIVIEHIPGAAGGVDTVVASGSFDLRNTYGEVENLELSNNGSGANLNTNAYGNALNNVLIGNNGNNILNGYGGADRMEGGYGNDIYYVDNPGDVVIEQMPYFGNDVILASVDYTLNSGSYVDVLATRSTVSTDAINLTGNELAQRVVGNAGNNILDGGAGTDTLVGNGGNDTFRFSTAPSFSNNDRIEDFSVADDTIQLDRTIFSALDLGTLNAAAFKDITMNAPLDSSDRILYDRTTGQLFYDPDGSGTAARSAFATLNNRPTTLSADDFFVVA